MLANKSDIDKYLSDFHAGRISKGLGLGCDLDKYLRFKDGSFNMILGHDNVGKTYWRCWYYLCLSVQYNYKWCIWTGENKAGQVVRDLIQQHSGRPFKELSISEVYRYKDEVLQWFTFVDNKKLHKYQDLLNIFESVECNGCLIDPYTGLDRKFGHSDNYEFLNTTRQWVNRTGKTIDVCSHPSTQSGRAGALYPQGHEWEGHLRRPMKADIEGGKPFGNRIDDFITLHRLTSHPDMKWYTQVYIDKVKDVETGGEQTMLDEPIMCEFNRGLGFTINAVNPLTPDKILTDKPLPLNVEFDNEEAPF